VLTRGQQWPCREPDKSTPNTHVHSSIKITNTGVKIIRNCEYKGSKEQYVFLKHCETVFQQRSIILQTVTLISAYSFSADY
jgi:hypothetical protein